MRTTMMPGPLAPEAQRPVGWWTAWAAAAVAALLAALHLQYPLDVDQGLFMAMAREMSEGAQLYRDFWDIKQPGLFLWYEAAGNLFGFDAVGLRWMDLGWAVGTALVVWATVRRRGAAVALLAPAIGIAVFYGRTTSWHLSQLEWILAAPVAAVVWCMDYPVPARSREWPASRYAFAGLLIAAIGIVKLVLVIVPLAIVCTALVLSLFGTQGRPDWRAAIVRGVLPLSIAYALSMGGEVLWLHREGTLPTAIWTAFVLPRVLIAEYHHLPLMQLVHAVRWYLVGTWAFWPGALWALARGVRERRRLELLYAAWVLVDLAAIGVQVMSFWEYQFNLLFVPLGALAAMGIVDFWATVVRPSGGATRRPLDRRQQSLLVLWTVCMVLSVAWPLNRKVVRVVQAWPFDRAHREALEDKIDVVWPVLRASAAAARPWLHEGERVVVWGDQRLVGLLDHRPVMEINGDATYSAQQVRDAAAYVEQHRPHLIYLSKRRDFINENGGDAFGRTVRRLYIPFHDDTDGIWYRLPGTTISAAEPPP